MRPVGKCAHCGADTFLGSLVIGPGLLGSQPVYCATEGCVAAAFSEGLGPDRLESTVNDDWFNTLCEAHSFGAVARGEFPLVPRGLLKALVDAAVAAERQRHVCECFAVRMLLHEGRIEDAKSALWKMERA